MRHVVLTGLVSLAVLAGAFALAGCSVDGTTAGPGGGPTSITGTSATAANAWTTPPPPGYATQLPASVAQPAWRPAAPAQPTYAPTPVQPPPLPMQPPAATTPAAPTLPTWTPPAPPPDEEAPGAGAGSGCGGGGKG